MRTQRSFALSTGTAPDISFRASLERYHTEVLVTGCDVKRMAAVIKRCMDLETGAAKPAAALLGKISSRP